MSLQQSTRNKQTKKHEVAGKEQEGDEPSQEWLRAGRRKSKFSEAVRPCECGCEPPDTAGTTFYFPKKKNKNENERSAFFFFNERNKRTNQASKQAKHNRQEQQQQRCKPGSLAGEVVRRVQLGACKQSRHFRLVEKMSQVWNVQLLDAIRCRVERLPCNNIHVSK